MARRNRKKADGFAFPARFSGLVIAFSVCALAYVWLCCRCEAVGREIKALEQENVELRRVYAEERAKWAKMVSPRNIEAALARNNLKMDWPKSSQIVRLYERGDDTGESSSPMFAGGVTYVRHRTSIMND